MYEVSKPSPGSSFYDGLDASRTNAIFACQFGLANAALCMSSTNLFDLNSCQPRIPLFFSQWPTMTPDSIVRIVFKRADLQMIGPYARRLIAFMPHDQTRRYWPIMQLIRKHMSADLILLLAKTKRLMMARIAPVPEPATIAFDDVPPESLNWRASAMGVMTRLAATAATASIYASLDFKELLPTVLAYARNALHRSRLIRAFLTAMLASTSSLSRSRDKEFRFTVLANAVNSGRIMFRHDSKLQFSICVQRPASVNALAGLAAL